MVSFMKKPAVEKATKRLEAAKRHLDACGASKNYTQFAEAWGDFLICGAAIFNILEAGAKSVPQGRQWYGQKRSEGRKDELILYMRQARNEEEHGIEAVSRERLVTLILSPPEGGTTIDVSKLDRTVSMAEALSDPSIYSGPIPNMTRRSTPALVPVTSKEGDIFQPPKTHKGAALRTEDPIKIGLTYLVYLEDLVEEASQYT